MVVFAQEIPLLAQNTENISLFLRSDDQAIKDLLAQGQTLCLLTSGAPLGRCVFLFSFEGVFIFTFSQLDKEYESLMAELSGKSPPPR